MRRSLIAAGVIVILATACSPGTPSPTAMSSPGDGTPSPTASPAEATAAGCPAGTWLFSNAELTEFWSIIEAESGDVPFTVEGTVLLDLNSDRTLVWTFQDYAVVIALPGAESRSTIEGRVTGDWSAESGTIRSINLTDETELTVTVNGAEIPRADEVATTIIDEFPLTEVPYRCAGGNLILDSPTALSTTEVTLVPA